jgi:hypothetical protein
MVAQDMGIFWMELKKKTPRKDILKERCARDTGWYGDRLQAGARIGKGGETERRIWAPVTSLVSYIPT